ncbi:MAG: RHS repeat-associated core domain-containing protein [Bacteroidales bacterium]|nr:RHS repeat-associated core domain-containing protein [Bacteroidales bacterium]
MEIGCNILANYGINGSLRRRDVQALSPYTEYYMFNSAANLKAYSNNGLDFAYYGYNAANTRTYKLSMLNMGQWVNGQPQPIHLQIQQAMFYPNAYLNFNHNGEYTKHYYNGAERIASRLGTVTLNNATTSNSRLDTRSGQLEDRFRNDIRTLVYAGDIPMDMPPEPVSATLQTTGTSSDIFYYHTNHLGSTAYVTDNNATITQGFLYAPFGEITTEYNANFGNNVLPKYSFNAKELDEETGMYYYEARYYKPPVFTSRDAMFEKYFWMTPYAYCANNPVKYVDPSGKEVSTHTDENGKVIKVYNDGNIGIYKHSKDEIKAFKNGQEFSNDVENLVGYTLHENSFKENDKIDFGSYVAKEWMKYFELWANNACIGQKDGIFKYGIMAVNGGIFDPKSRLKNGSQISDMVYFSPRDLGNYAAGYIGKKLGFSKTEILARYGAFELSGNNMKKLIGSYKELYLKALAYPPSSSGQRTYGEAPISNFFQRLGYEGINSIDDYIKRYSDIWKD